jgi:hypothetical protein
MRRQTLLNVAALLITSCSVAAAEDALDRRLSRIAGTSVDCGSTGGSSPNRAAVNACVSKHFLKNEAFRPGLRPGAKTQSARRVSSWSLRGASMSCTSTVKAAGRRTKPILSVEHQLSNA